MTEPGYQRPPQKVIGYVLTANRDAMEDSRQTEVIQKYVKSKGDFLVFMESEVGSARTILRPGLWRSFRALICYKCANANMPPTIDTPEWLDRVVDPCRCSEPEGLDGIVVAMMGSICTNAPHGARAALLLAQMGKHLFIASEDRCVSCCNPAAAKFLRAQI